MESKVDRLLDQLERLSAIVLSNQNRVTVLEEQAGNPDIGFEALGDRCGNLASEFYIQEPAFQEMASALKDVDVLNEQMKSVMSSFDLMESRHDELDERQDELEGNLDELEEEFSRLPTERTRGKSTKALPERDTSPKRS